jgi:hypothetical protein
MFYYWEKRQWSSKYDICKWKFQFKRELCIKFTNGTENNATGFDFLSVTFQEKNVECKAIL